MSGPAPAASFGGRFRFVDLLGSGGMGAVWRVWDERERRYVAAKVLRLQRADALLRFVVEQSTRISHPHVLTPTGWSADDERVMFTMELVDGGSVADLLGDYGALPVHLVVDLLDQLLQALEAVHGAGVVHRDVTPANLLLAATGHDRPHLLLSDFGVAVRGDLPRLTSTAEVVGTRGYLAPEVVRGGDPSAAGDLFAVGVVAVELLTGQAPGPDEPAAALRARLDDVAAPWPLLSLVRSLLDDDPGRRPKRAADARQAVASLRGGAPVAGDRDHEDGVHVLHQLPDLPDGWGAGGPEPAGPGSTAGAGGAATAPVPGVPVLDTARAGAANLPGWYRPVVVTTAALLTAVVVAVGALLLGG